MMKKITTAMPAGTECRKRRDQGDNRAEGGPDQGDEVGDRDEQGDQRGEPDAAEFEDGVGEDAEQGEGALDDLGALQDREVGQHEDGDGGDDAGADSAQQIQRRCAQAGGKLADAGLVVLHELQGVGAFEQVPDRAAAGAGVADDAGKLPGEAAALGGQGHGEGGEQAAEDEDHDEEHHQCRQGSPAQVIRRYSKFTIG
jgi:hypothetical protein